MDYTFGVFEGTNILYSTNFIDPLLVNLVVGLNDIASEYVSDSLNYVELDEYSVSVSFIENKLAFVCANKKKEKVDLKFFIDSYRKCIKEDIKLLDKLLLDNYCFKR